MTELSRQILEHKRRRREVLSLLSYPEKVRIVEKLRDASKRMKEAATKQGLNQGYALDFLFS